MADQKIWSNETGQVMLGAGGMVLRQPFNFGKGFFNNGNSTVHLRIPIKGFDKTNHSFTFWINKFGSTSLNYNLLRYPSSKLNYIRTTSAAGGALTFTEESGFSNIMQNTDGATSFPRCHTFGKTGKRTARAYNNVYAQSSVQYSAIEADVDYIYVGEGTLFNVLGHLFIYNRMLSASENYYIYANGVGALPITNQGRIAYLPLNEAEIIDFSTLQDGSDMRVGCRDVSGNINHAELMNLPAGTLAEKVAWANSNVFTSLTA